MYWATEHLKMSGIYWGLGAMHMMNSLNEMDCDKIVDFVLACQQPNGNLAGEVVYTRF